QPDMYFFSNDKRFQRFIEGRTSEHYSKQTIVTSNVNAFNDQYRFRVNYSNYLNTQPLVNDNATLMLLTLFTKLNIDRVTIAGFDGFQKNSSRNYFENELETSLDKTSFQVMNEQITEALREIQSRLEII